MSLPDLKPRLQFARAAALQRIVFRPILLDGAIRNALCAIAVLTVLRIVLAAALPLSFDEAYFWLWSKHLAISYYDHPPLIALAIAGGTAIFGDTEIGVRMIPLLSSVLASWAVWRAAATASRDETTGAIACLLLNATLMFAAESMSATPDSLMLAAASLLLFSIAKLEASRDGRWWLAAGLSAGLALFAKYTAFFLCGSIVLWLLASPRGRRWLRSPWVYLGALAALVFLVPTLWWNATHGFISFKFQLARVSAGHPTWRYLAEFAGSQLALASPFILVLAVAGLSRCRPFARRAGPLGFASAMIWPALAYFLVHATHDRVQGNWPSFIYPALAMLAAHAYTERARTGRSERALSVVRILALPVAGLILTVAYAQAFFGAFPLGHRDPIARMTAVGMPGVAGEIEGLATREHAAAILTTNYVTTGWLSFYTHRSVPIVQIGSDDRFLSAPAAGSSLLSGRLLYVTQEPEKELPRAAVHFSRVRFVALLNRSRAGVPIDRFGVYDVSGFHGAPLGRLP